MKFKIKHRFSGAVLFTLETDSLRLCVEAAVKSGSDLSGSDLRVSDSSHESTLFAMKKGWFM